MEVASATAIHETFERTMLETLTRQVQELIAGGHREVLALMYQYVHGCNVPLRGEFNGFILTFV